MPMHDCACRFCFSVIAIAILSAAQAHAASFILGGDANGLSGLASKLLTDDGIGMSLAVGANLPGAVFDESDSRGVTIDSSAVVGITDIEGSGKINLLGGSVATESLTFSFDTSGVIEDIFFDGMTDNSLEFFRLESSGGYLATFFDFEIPNIVDDLNDIPEPNIEYVYTGGGLNDDRLGINIPFQAGEVFTLSYGQVDSLVPPSEELGNGARFGGVNVHAVTVPEPGSAFVLLSMAAILALQRTARCLQSRG